MIEILDPTLSRLLVNVGGYLCPTDFFSSVLWHEFLVTLALELLELLLEILGQQGTGSVLHRLSQTFLSLLHSSHVSRFALILFLF